MAYVVRGKSGKVVGRYATQAEAERRIAQLKAGAARLRPFQFASGSARSPVGRDTYTKRQAPENALQTNVYRNGHIIGTITLRGKRHWVWWYGYIPVGLSSQPSGTVRTERGGLQKIVAYDKPATRRSGESPTENPHRAHPTLWKVRVSQHGSSVPTRTWGPFDSQAQAAEFVEQKKQEARQAGWNLVFQAVPPRNWDPASDRRNRERSPVRRAARSPTGDVRVIADKLFGGVAWTISRHTRPNGTGFWALMELAGKNRQDYPVVRDDAHGRIISVVYDHPERLPEAVKNWTERVLRKVSAAQRSPNGRGGIYVSLTPLGKWPAGHHFRLYQTDAASGGVTLESLGGERLSQMRYVFVPKLRFERDFVLATTRGSR